MAFDLEAFRDAHRPWQLTAGGRSFTARHVSAPAVLAFHQAYSVARTEDGRRRALLRLLRLAFPWRFSYLLRGDPVRIMARLEPAAMAAAIESFFQSIGGKGDPSPPPTIPGTRSATPSSPA